jgi:hypothetical protein
VTKIQVKWLAYTTKVSTPLKKIIYMKAPTWYIYLTALSFKEGCMTPFSLESGKWNEDPKVQNKYDENPSSS